MITHNEIGVGRYVMLLALLATGAIGTTPGCAVLGSQAIRSGRLSYNEAIAYTEAQQLLLNILRVRYAEPTTALAVASVTANATVHAETGINLGFGPKDSYSGNLVPFSGGFYYEENPTIAYLPVQGEDSIRRLMAPIPLDITVSLLRSPLLGAQFLSTLVSRINDLRNPDFLSAATAPPDPRFHRLVDLVTSLHRHGHLFWVTRPKNDNAFAVVLSGYAPDHAAEVRELLRLLDVSQRTDTDDIVLEVSLAVGESPSHGMAIMTRSVYDLTLVLAAATEVPKEDERTGRAAEFPPIGIAGANLHVRHAAHQPKDASVAVQFKDQWFYIADTDQSTKRHFQLLRSLWSAMLADTPAQTRAAPVLTIPIGN